MKIFRSVFPFSLCVLFLFPIASLTQTGVPVKVVNRANEPLPVKVVEKADRTPFQLALDVSFSPTEYPSVPAGKIFVVEYVTARMRTFNTLGTAPCKLLSISFDARPDAASTLEPFAFNPVVLGSVPGLANEIHFSVINQPATIFVAPNSQIGLSLQASPSCVTPFVTGRMALTGYLIDS